MHSKNQFHNLVFRTISCAATAALAIAFVLIVVATQSAQAQTFNVLHNFTGGQDGEGPAAGLTIDKAGNLYGTAEGGGSGGWGTVFKLARRGPGWVFTPLYSFAGGNDGALPTAPVVFGPDGSLYGTTYSGGGNNCPQQTSCGTVFKLKPPVTFCGRIFCPWIETVLYRFRGGSDGNWPWSGVVFDPAGNIYGATQGGGGDQGCNGWGCGTVYELSPSGSGWMETILHSFVLIEGGDLYGGVVFDRFGNLYGTAGAWGFYGTGALYQLTPSSSGWIFNDLYDFRDESGSYPNGTLIVDASGDLYGTTAGGGTGGGGTAFLMTPAGNWTHTVLYNFPSGSHPEGGLVMDRAGNLYGTTWEGGAYSLGSVFKLTFSGGGWVYTSLHDFMGSDGANPYTGSLIFDKSGNIYGTAQSGGSQNYGVVWEITP